MKMSWLILTKDFGDCLEWRTKGKIAFVLCSAFLLYLTPSASIAWDDYKEQTYSNFLRRENEKEIGEAINEAIKNPGHARARPQDNPRFAECDRAHVECSLNICGNLTGEGMNHFNECFADCDAKREVCLAGSSTGSSNANSAATSAAVNLVNTTAAALYKGDVAAQLELANHYSSAGNEKAATVLFEMAAQQGHPQAQYILASRYYFGVGVEKDSTAAVGWLFKAAEQGVMEAQFGLGTAYLYGDGVGRNLSMAHKYYKKGADSGLSAAYGPVGWVSVLLNRPTEAIQYSRMAIAADPLNSALYNGNVAHGLLLNGQYEAARDIYIENQDSIFQDGRRFRQAVLDDFKEMRKEGTNHPDMLKIERLMRY